MRRAMKGRRGGKYPKSALGHSAAQITSGMEVTSIVMTVCPILVDKDGFVAAGLVCQHDFPVRCCHVASSTEIIHVIARDVKICTTMIGVGKQNCGHSILLGNTPSTRRVVACIFDILQWMYDIVPCISGVNEQVTSRRGVGLIITHRFRRI